MKLNRVCSRIVLFLLAMQLLVVLLSWILSVVCPSLGVQSLLSREGVRHFAGSLVSASHFPFLLPLIYAAIAVGCFFDSGLSLLVSRLVFNRVGREILNFRERFAFQMSVLTVFAAIVVLLLLILPSDAIFLSATGTLWQGIFPKTIVPLLSTALVVSSLVFGWFSGRNTSADSIFNSLCVGLKKASPIIVVYIVFAVFISSVIYALGL